MRRVFALGCVTLIAATIPLSAQVAVVDPVAIARLAEIVKHVRTTIAIAREEYETVTRIGRGFGGSLGRYRVPAIPTMNHDVGRYLYGAALLDGLNSGDPRGERYTQVVRPVVRPGGLFESLTPEARRILEATFATLEIYDSVATLGVHESALSRGYGTQIAGLIEQLQADVINPGSEYHETTAIADKLAVAGLINARQNQNSNQVESSILEQLLAKNKRTRDAAAAHSNMQINAILDGGAMSGSMVENAGTTLQNWRLP